MIHFAKNQALAELGKQVQHGVGIDEGLGNPYISFTVPQNENVISIAFSSIDAINDLDYSIFLIKGLTSISCLPLSNTLKKVVNVLLETERKKCTLHHLQNQIKNIDLQLISSLDPLDVVISAHTLSDEDITGEDPKNVIVSLKSRFIDNIKFFENYLK